MMKPLQSLGLVTASALGLASVSWASASWAGLPRSESKPVPEPPAMADSPCPASTFDVYFRALDSEVSTEAKALMVGLALAYRGCQVERIEIESLAVDSASPDSTPEIAAQRGENLAGLMRLIFLGRADVVVRVEQAEDAFGPETRRAQVRLVT